jgi:hypothetical protein
LLGLGPVLYHARALGPWGANMPWRSVVSRSSQRLTAVRHLKIATQWMARKARMAMSHLYTTHVLQTCIRGPSGPASTLRGRGDLEGTESSFSPNVRSRRCSQVERAVLRQDAAVRRYGPRVIRTMRAQKPAPFPGIAHDVLAHLQLRRVVSGRDRAVTRQADGLTGASCRPGKHGRDFLCLAGAFRRLMRAR